MSLELTYPPPPGQKFSLYGHFQYSGQVFAPEDPQDSKPAEPLSCDFQETTPWGRRGTHCFRVRFSLFFRGRALPQKEGTQGFLRISRLASAKTNQLAKFQRALGASKQLGTKQWGLGALLLQGPPFGAVCNIRVLTSKKCSCRGKDSCLLPPGGLRRRREAKGLCEIGLIQEPAGEKEATIQSPGGRDCRPGEASRGVQAGEEPEEQTVKTACRGRGARPGDGRAEAPDSSPTLEDGLTLWKMSSLWRTAQKA